MTNFACNTSMCEADMIQTKSENRGDQLRSSFGVVLLK